MAQFEEFLKEKNAKEQAEKDEEDFEIEIGDKDGNFVRTRRSHAKPFLQRMGLDLDPESTDGSDKNDGGDKNKGTRKPRQTAAPTTVKKYFSSK